MPRIQVLGEPCQEKPKNGHDGPQKCFKCPFLHRAVPKKPAKQTRLHALPCLALETPPRLALPPPRLTRKTCFVWQMDNPGSLQRKRRKVYLVQCTADGHKQSRLLQDKK